MSPNGATGVEWTLDIGVPGVDRPVDGDGGDRVVGLDGLARCHRPARARWAFSVPGATACAGLVMPGAYACAGLVPGSLPKGLDFAVAIQATPLHLLPFLQPLTLPLYISDWLDRWQPSRLYSWLPPPPPEVPLLDPGLDPQPGAAHTVTLT